MENDFKKLEELLKGKIKKALDFGLRSSFLTKQSEILANDIRTRTRLRKGVKSNGNTEPLKSLKETTVKTRKKYSRNLSEFTTPARSNLTATGQLLDALVGKFTNSRIIIYFRENRLYELSGSRARAKHKDMVEGIEKGGKGRKPRPFFKVSNAERTKISRAIRQEVLKGLK